MNPRKITDRNIPMLSVFGSSAMLSLLYYLIVYENSSLLETVMSVKTVSALYVGGSILTFFFFLYSAKIIHRFGMYHFILSAALFEGIAISGLAFSHTAFLLGLFFVLHQISIVMVFLSLDVYLEALIVEENHTGHLRSMYLTVGNTASVIGPFIASFIIVGVTYKPVYILSAILMIPFLLLAMGGVSKISVPEPNHINILETFKEFFANKDIVFVSGAHLFLQTFYAFMVVYMPLYLHDYIGFDWSTLGILFTIMLLPFVIFEIPVGRIADNMLGEKEFMILGLLIMAVILFLSPLLTTASFGAWALLLFLSRIGASFLEVTTESYFFKQVNGKNENIISIFRSLRALGYIISSGLAIAFLYFIPFKFLFTVFGALALIAILSARMITDTR